MKQLLLLPFLYAGTLHSNEHKFTGKTSPLTKDAALNMRNALQLGINEGGSSRMRAAIFKAQEFCRVELKDFEFDVQFSVVSAVVYFSGANFTNVEKATISSNSLKPIRDKMDRCTPGSVVIFDEVKVKGPDNQVRTIAGLSLVLF